MAAKKKKQGASKKSESKVGRSIKSISLAIQDYQDRRGWTDSVMIALLLEWVEEVGEKESFLAFLDQRAESEDAISSDTPDEDLEEDLGVNPALDEPEDYDPGDV